MSCVSSLAVALLLYILAPDFARLFSLAGESYNQAIEYQRFMSYCVVLFAAYMPTTGLLQGSGDAVWASMTSFVTLALRVAVGYLMVYSFDVGYAACWLNMPFGWGLGVIMSWPRYFSGRWMTKRVVGDVLPEREGGLVE